MKIPKVLDKKNYKITRGLDGLGLCAVKDIKKGSWIIEYIGIRKKSKEVENLKTQYLFEVTKQITIDGSPRFNTARYINYSCDPNAEAWNINNRIFIKAIQNIQKGQEITYDYGEEFFKTFIEPKGCKCIKCKNK